MAQTNLRRVLDPQCSDVVKDGLIVTFKSTKTIQFRERKLHISLLRIPGSPLCPVKAYRRMIKLVPAPSSSALFLLPKPGGLTLLTKRRFICEFRRSLSTAGLNNAQCFRGHSFRRGAQLLGPLTMGFLEN